MSTEPTGGEPKEAPGSLASLVFYPANNPKVRLFALWYFATLITVWNLVGHTILGFEQSWLQYFVALFAGCSLQIFLEWVDATTKGRKPRFSGGWLNFVNFMPPAIIASSACSMLIFPNNHYWPIVFAVTLSIGSKVMFRAPVGNGATQHVFNPSNLGVVVTLFTIPWVGIAPPYHFTNTVEGVGNLILPAIVMATGIFLHWKCTGRLPLLLAWLGGFAVQGLIRAAMWGAPWYVPLYPMTSASFILFTMYMIPDPATTPISTIGQVLFGLGVAALYGILFQMHIVFGLFLALTIVCGIRGIYLHLHCGLVGGAVPRWAPLLLRRTVPWASWNG